jgi:hypothetical protein
VNAAQCRFLATGASASACQALPWCDLGVDFSPVILWNFWTKFYDQETSDFTLSVLRDFWKSGVLLLAAGGFFVFLKALGVAGYGADWLEIWEWLDGAFTTCVLVYTFLDFMGKLIFRKPRTQGAPSHTRRRA